MRITFDLPDDGKDILTAPSDLPESIAATLILPAGRGYAFPTLLTVGGLTIETDGDIYADPLAYAHHIDFKGSPQIFATWHTRVEHITANDVEIPLHPLPHVHAHHHRTGKDPHHLSAPSPGTQPVS